VVAGKVDWYGLSFYPIDKNKNIQSGDEMHVQFPLSIIQQLYLTIACVLFLCPRAATGDVIAAMDFTEIGETGTRYEYNASFVRDGTSGWSFNVSEGITVVSLGYYDHLMDGFVDSHQVGLWRVAADRNSATLLASTTLSSGSGAELDGSFRYNDVTPFALTPGESYIIAGVLGVGTGQAEFDYTVRPTAAGWTSTVGITNVDNAFGFMDVGASMSDSNWPDEGGGPPGIPGFGPNFRVSVAAVPEPGSILLIGVLFSLFLGRNIMKRGDPLL